MRPSIKELSPFRADIAGMFRLAAELGCAAVQVHLPDEERAAAIRAAMRETGVGVASVCAMSCDMLGPDRARQEREHRNVARALELADRLGAPTVTNFAGRDPGLDLAGNAAEFARVYAPHARAAERLGLRIVFENCPMLGGVPRHARNLAWCPAHWRALFATLDSPALGIELDVSHCVYAGLDAPAIIRAWRARIHHVQIKDARVDRAAAAERGSLEGLPHELVPLGEGEVDSGAVVAALRDIGYAGYVTADYEGPDVEAAARNVRAMLAAMGRHPAPAAPPR
jgi:sugar phosphate isomerase/epimerase